MGMLGVGRGMDFEVPGGTSVSGKVSVLSASSKASLSNESVHGAYSGNGNGNNANAGSSSSSNARVDADARRNKMPRTGTEPDTARPAGAGVAFNAPVSGSMAMHQSPMQMQMLMQHPVSSQACNTHSSSGSGSGSSSNSHGLAAFKSSICASSDAARTGDDGNEMQSDANSSGERLAALVAMDSSADMNMTGMNNLNMGMGMNMNMVDPMEGLEGIVSDNADDVNNDSGYFNSNFDSVKQAADCDASINISINMSMGDGDGDGGVGETDWYRGTV
jgi:hypothetical protein